MNQTPVGATHVATRRLILAGAVALSPAALAQGEAPATSFLSLLLPLLAVLGTLLVALVWLNRSRGLYRSDGPLKIVQVLPLSPRERVVVLESDRGMMVVGVASGRVSLLSTLDPVDTASGEPPGHA